MSEHTLNLTCIQCKESLLVGRASRAIGWYMYADGPHNARLNCFINRHLGHVMRFEDSTSTDDDVLEFS